MLSLVLVGLLAVGSRALPAPWGLNSRDSSIPVDYDGDTWVLSTTHFVPNYYQVQPYIANGYHGARLTAEGFGFWRQRNATHPDGRQPVQGWPEDNPRETFATVSGFWDSQRNTTRTNFPELLDEGGESVIAGIPTWTGLLVTTERGHTFVPSLDASHVSHYRQSLSLKTGVVETSLRWTPDLADNSTYYKLKYTTYAHRKYANVGAVRLEVSSPNAGRIRITDVLDGRGAIRTTFHGKRFVENDDVITTSVSPVGLANVTAHEYSTVQIAPGSAVVPGSRVNAQDREYVSRNESTIAQEWQVNLPAGQPVAVEKYVGIASSDAFPNDPAGVAAAAAEAAKAIGWSNLLDEHEEGWEALWESGDVVVPGDDELQRSFRSSLFHLLANIRSADEGNGLVVNNSVSVGGLSSDSYAGFVFWDADLWIFPGLLALFPGHAKVINDYRDKLLPQAAINAAEYDLDGILYPWTSGRFGNCTATGPCVDYQYHLNTDIAHAHWNYFLSTGDEEWLRNYGWPVIKGVTEMFADLVFKNETTGGKYWISNMTDPDEYANHIDNGGFTNGGVVVQMGIAQEAASVVGETAPEIWRDIQQNMYIPYDSGANIIVEYAGMNGSVEIKQADIVLLNYPLEFRLNTSQALSDLDFYARAQSPDGPAMTWAMFAVGSAELAETGCSAYTYTLFASEPYIRRPYYQFSEQISDNFDLNGGTNPAFTFLTGHGGFLQIATHGFTGHRLRRDALYLDPILPPQIPGGFQLHGLKYHNGSFDINIGPDITSITRRVLKDGPTTPITVRLAQTNAHAGDYPLVPGQTLRVPTRRPDLQPPTIPGNIAQCAPVDSMSGYVAGQYPLAAVDGSNATVWQPISGVPSALDIDLGSTKSFSSIHINWGRIPADSFSVFTSGGGIVPQSDSWTLIHEEEDVAVSEPWDPIRALEVRQFQGNQTTVSLASPQQARWLRIVVEGSKEGEQTATVAEIGVIA